jgi:8-oxo-dGTP pyrophosphatase MutT (NUDIX family)
MVDHFLRGDSGLPPCNAVVGLIVLDDGRYLMQLRSQKPGIFYPGHWGLFGGALEQDETAIAALRRELKEELALDLAAASYFTEFVFDFRFRGLGRIWRKYYHIPIAADAINQLVLGEGADMSAFDPRDILLRSRVVPYDAFAIWLHATGGNLDPSRSPLR